MKNLNLILVFACLLFAAGASAQNDLPVKQQATVPNITPDDEAQTKYTKYRRSNEVVQSMGKTYTANELQSMPARDINKVANTVGGVQSRAGETPTFRGADPSGTAYYIDGVRVYGRIR